MDDLVARCRSCGYEQPTEFAQCPVCLGAFAWWCVACRAWRPDRNCPACTAIVAAGDEVYLGEYPPGSQVPVHFSVRNPGKKTLDFALSSFDPALTLLTRRVAIRPGQDASVFGLLALGTVPPGRRTYRIRLETSSPAEAIVTVDVVPAMVRLEFEPPELTIRNAQPGTAITRHLRLTNAGNVPVSAVLAGSASWLGVQPAQVDLEPGEDCRVKVSTRTRKTDCGTLTGDVLVTPLEGESSAAKVRVQLPEPKLEADPVDFGEVNPDRPAHQAVVLRNVGKVRVACSLATDEPWLQVTPTRVSLPAGGEKVVKLRALVPADNAGAKAASLQVSFVGGELLRVPVSLFCRVPVPILGAIRKQTLGAIAADLEVVRRFGVANVGDGRLRCSISADQQWIEVLTPELTVTPGKRRRVEYRIHAPRLTPGIHHATIHVRSSGGDAAVPLKVQVVPPAPRLEVLGDLDLGTVVPDAIAEGHLTLRNDGVGVLHVRAEADSARVSVTPSESMLAPGPPAKLAVTIVTEGLSPGPQAFEVRLTSDGGDAIAAVRLRLPVEQIDAPVLLVLGDRRAGRNSDESIALKNTGPDPIVLAVRPEDPWLVPVVSSVELAPYQSKELPFRAVVPRDSHGALKSGIWLKGRTIRHRVGVAVVARTIDLKVMPPVVPLGRMSTGEERAVTFEVVNRGDMKAVLADLHVRGDLEVTLQARTIRPGETVTVPARVRMNARRLGRKVWSEVAVGDEAGVRFTARVVPARGRQIASAALGTGGLAAATGLWLTGLPQVGIMVGADALLAALVILTWQAWREG